MAILTTVSEVEELMQKTLDDAYVASILTTTDLVLTKIFENYSGDLSNDLLTELQKYFAAHLIASTTERMGSEEKVGEASIKYLGSYTTGLDSTPYGQMLKLIDITGLIGKSGKTAVGMYAIKSFD